MTRRDPKGRGKATEYLREFRGVPVVVKMLDVTPEVASVAVPAGPIRGLTVSSLCCGRRIRLPASSGRLQGRYEVTCPRCGFPWTLKKVGEGRGAARRERLDWRGGHGRLRRVLAGDVLPEESAVRAPRPRRGGKGNRRVRRGRSTAT